MGELEVPCPPYLEGLIRVREVRLSVLYYAAQRLEDVALLFDLMQPGRSTVTVLP